MITFEFKVLRSFVFVPITIVFTSMTLIFTVLIPFFPMFVIAVLIDNASGWCALLFIPYVLFLDVLCKPFGWLIDNF